MDYGFARHFSAPPFRDVQHGAELGTASTINRDAPIFLLDKWLAASAFISSHDRFLQWLVNKTHEFTLNFPTLSTIAQIQRLAIVQ
jgi:hypothetical protein